MSIADKLRALEFLEFVENRLVLWPALVAVVETAEEEDNVCRDALAALAAALEEIK